jgi:hypothetical protein
MIKNTYNAALGQNNELPQGFAWLVRVILEKQ